jgi:hypothetical protein
MFDWWHAVEAISLALAIIALLVGVVHLREIKRTTESLSTRFIGTFPHFLPSIVDLIQQAKTSVIVVCDYPGYGRVSDPDNGLAYRHALERQIQLGRRVELTCMDRERRRRQAAELWNRMNWDDWRAENRDKISTFVAAHDNIAEPLTITRDEFLRILDEGDEQLLGQLFRKNAVQLPVDIPLYFWIADERVAVFSVPTLAVTAFEYGFRTSDRALIQALLDVRQRLRNRFEEPPAGAGASGPRNGGTSAQGS